MTDLILTNTEYKFLRCLSEKSEATFETIRTCCDLSTKEGNELLSKFLDAKPPLVKASGHIQVGSVSTRSFGLTFEGEQRVRRDNEQISKTKMGFWESNFDFLKNHWKNNKHKTIWWVIGIVWSITLLFLGIFIKSFF